MQIRPFALLAPLAAVILAVALPASLQAQGRVQGQTAVTISAVVPSVVKYVVDESVRTPDGAPTVRVITNDPAIRRTMANGVPAEQITRQAAQESSSMHSKGAEQVLSTESDSRMVRYTVVAP